jgi:phosphoserine phosphatase RsbU/P
MLPQEMLRASPVTVAHQFQPVDIVGGDFLDYFQLGDGTVGFYVGDVSGKGLQAAMYAALTVGVLRGIHKTGQSPCRILHTLNQRFDGPGIVAAPHGHRLRGISIRQHGDAPGERGNAGPSGSGCSVLNVSGIPPGLFADADYETLTVILEPGDCVMLCSDGIIEAQNARFEDFGIDRLMAICGARGGLSPEELLSQIFLAVHNFTHVIQQHDDMAAAILQVDP